MRWESDNDAVSCEIEMGKNEGFQKCRRNSKVVGQSERNMPDAPRSVFYQFQT